MPKYRLSVEFEAANIDEAWSTAQEYGDWGGEPSVAAMKKEGMTVEEVGQNIPEVRYAELHARHKLYEEWRQEVSIKEVMNNAAVFNGSKLVEIPTWDEWMKSLAAKLKEG